MILASASQEIQILLDAVALGSVYAVMAVGIGLVFGVLRLVNFAYGQLIMVGAYALALTSDQRPAVSILVCFAVVLAFTMAMEVAVFRPLRSATPSTMLVATFAVSFLLQAIAIVKFGTIGKIAVVLPGLFQPVSIGSVHVRWITIVSIVVGAGALGGIGLLLGRTSIGLQMRAAAVDFSTARVLGVRANAVIAVAVFISGLLAATVAVILPIAAVPLVTPDYGLKETIFVLVGVVVGGLDRLWSATLGGFAIGFATSYLGAKLPIFGLGEPVYLDSAVFLLVILVLLIRPGGLFAPSRRSAAERV
jgi:branched-chain amino acid transport system permease protein